MAISIGRIQMKYLYLDCSAGIQEEAVISALLGIGAEERTVTEAVRSLPVPGIVFSAEKGPEDSFYRVSMDWKRTKDTDTEKKLKNWLAEGKLSPNSKAAARRILERYCSGVRREPDSSDLPFHLVRMMVYAVALAACLEDLGVWKVIIPCLGEGSGFFSGETGVQVVPGWEIIEILKGTKIRLCTTPAKQELITPGGAAMAAAIQTSDRLPDQYRIIRHGAGALPGRGRGVISASLMEDDGIEQGIVYRLETNMDDVTGEALGYVMERLLQAGAGDVHYHSVYMKKNRPAYQLNVICTEALIPVMEEIIFQETPTLGIRRVPMFSSRLERTCVSLETSLGPVRAKISYVPRAEGGRQKRIDPEYSSVTELCRKYGKSFQEVYQLLTAEFQRLE